MGQQENRVGLTMKRCAELPCPAGKERCYYHDTQMPALCLCVTRAGSRTFYVCRRVNGKPARMRVGRFPDLTLDLARKEAQRINGEVAVGNDPQAAKRAARDEPTLQQLFDYYLEHHAKPHKKSAPEDERMFRVYLSPWAKRRLSSIQRTDVQALHTKLGKENGIYVANRVRSLLCYVFNFGPDLGWKGVNPAVGIKAYQEQSRERFLQPAEMPRFLEAVEIEADRKFRDYFLCCLFTGARRSNVAAMRWEEINFEFGTWTIPKTKNGQAVTLPLVPTVVEILRFREKGRDGSPWVFPGKGKDGHVTAPKETWRRILKRAGLENFRVHDLRRTFGSWQAATGASLPIIGKSLGHKGHSATQVYARLELDPVRAAVQAATSAMLAAGQLAKEGGEDE